MKILHISFHKGCQNDIEYICNKLGHEIEHMNFDDGETKTNAIYNIGHERAKKCWDKYKNYFYTFDIIITSDTCPISRVFLQHNYEKKLIIWICNRFDYYDRESLDCDFPDVNYYNLIKDCKKRKNVIMVSYTPFEIYYAQKIKFIEINNKIIKPIGKISAIYFTNLNEENNKNNKNIFFVPPYKNDTVMINLSKKLTDLNILNYNGRYNSPLELKQYKAIIHIPYAWSNLALFECIQLGIIYFIPSNKFLNELKKNRDFFWTPPYIENMLHLSEWYCDENFELFVYFESWDDLVIKTNTLDYEQKHNLILEFGKIHEKKYLNMWSEILTTSIMKMYYINLNHRTDRNENMKIIINYIDKFNIKPYRIEAINGKLLNNYYIKSLSTNNFYTKMTKGEIGCYLSHIKMIEEFEKSFLPFGLMFEDDIHINIDYCDCVFGKIMDNIFNIDFDICLLSVNSLGGSKFYVGEELNNELYKMNYYGYGMHAYILSKKGALKLLNLHKLDGINYAFDLLHEHVKKYKELFHDDLNIISVKPDFIYYNDITMHNFLEMNGKEYPFFINNINDSDTR